MLELTRVVVLVAVLLPLVRGWWVFSRDEEDVAVQAAVNVSGECELLAHQGDCAFYSCLDSRFPCGGRGYALKHGLRYCQKFNANRQSFNDEGKEWVTASRTCMTRELLATYRREEVTCKDISRQGFRTLSDCFLSNGFCSIVWDNKRPLLQVAEARSLLDRLAASRIWREILDLARGCARFNLRLFMEWALQDVDLPLHG